MAGTPNSYSFTNFYGTLVDGASGSIVNIGFGSGPAPDGLSFAMDEDKVSKTIGADGSVMYSVHASNGGRITYRALKTSPVNAALDAVYRSTTINGGATCGQIVITAQDLSRGDAITASQCAIAKRPDVGYGNDASVMEWVFHVGQLNMVLGNGTPA